MITDDIVRQYELLRIVNHVHMIPPLPRVSRSVSSLVVLPIKDFLHSLAHPKILFLIFLVNGKTIKLREKLPNQSKHSEAEEAAVAAAEHLNSDWSALTRGHEL